VYQKYWCRDLKQLRKVRAAGKNCTRVPIEEKESYKWLEGVTAACQQTQADTLIHVCDRDADIYELLSHCLTHGTHFVVRAVHSRGTAQKGVKSFAKLGRIPVRGSYTLAIQSRSWAKVPVKVGVDGRRYWEKESGDKQDYDITEGGLPYGEDESTK